MVVLLGLDVSLDCNVEKTSVEPLTNKFEGGVVFEGSSMVKGLLRYFYITFIRGGLGVGFIALFQFQVKFRRSHSWRYSSDHPSPLSYLILCAVDWSVN